PVRGFKSLSLRQFFTMRARLSKAPPEFLPHEGYSPFPGRL
ncbi:MAG: hypothetical protein B193_2171, partial [Solidesulfovibrio magneticus str. Maddingley MBC34]